MLDISKALISPSQCEQVIEHLDNHIKPLMYINNKPGTYAPNRNEVWLNIHTPLTQWDKNTPIPGQFAPGVHDERLWTWCVKIAQQCGLTPNTGLVVYGESGIKLHRDSSALTPSGVTINLGSTNFMYADSRDNDSPNQ